MIYGAAATAALSPTADVVASPTTSWLLVRLAEGHVRRRQDHT